MVDRGRPALLAGWAAVILVLALLALARPIDHDESQYVAAAVLTAHGALPYRDYAYLQAPLQPLLFAPIAWAAGGWAWPALRLANALCGALTLWCGWRTARLIAPAGVAIATTALFASCDIFLFCIGTARNDALPAAGLAGALWLAVRADQGGASRRRALLAGLLLAGATAAKISYALPALAYGGWALIHRRHRPVWIALGALPVALVVLWTAWPNLPAFLFGVLRFPADAPADFYADRPWKLSDIAKLIDLLKFLALGPALLALCSGRPRPALLALLVLAGLIAAALPTPSWRQYLLPALPPLFAMLAWRWAQAPPSRAVRALAAGFALVGLTPTAIALAAGRPAMPAALRQGAAIRAAMDRAGATGPVATLSPQFLPATGRRPDPRFAAGSFVFRSRRLLAPGDAAALTVVTRADLGHVTLPPTILIGGEGAWTGGDDRLDALLEAEAVRRGYTRIAVPDTPFRLYRRAAITPA